MLNRLISECPKFVDLTNTDHLELVKSTVDSLLMNYSELTKIIEIEKELIAKNDTSLIFILLALKIAKSKLMVAEIKEPVKISVVFAVYKEHKRILEKSEHPHGEDFLRKKVTQLEYLFNDLPNFQ
ncbi:MAG: hypothetical protein D8M58_13775 [Calditrichaeota bacterium]|nr:MAG: hypothetical protein DWQ03_15015 [Calditrichota bacterium]MBL1206469.1 hypothetical protein [Calditrichota bacterium]NOG46296.1 hypothetical protein [Calditrichota bacterium]